VLRIPRSLFLKMLDGYPDAAARLRDSLARRSNEWDRDISNVRSVLEAREQK
jgi:CRP-like cAMP-binding protein